MPEKTVVESKTQTQKKTTTESDGTVVEVITTTITEKYSDGSSGTRTETKTIRTGGGTAPGGSGGAGMLDVNLTPATSKSPKVDNTTDKAFIQQCLDTHNQLRAKHGASPLTLDADLGKIAQAWAKKIADKGKMEHNTTGFGENVYWNTENPAGNRPADAWYSEIKDYNFGKLEGQKGTGHFTQLIWKSSKAVGIAMEKGNNGYYVVANYYPAGNIVGRYGDNIQK